jgi:hypothetical protein
MFCLLKPPSCRREGQTSFLSEAAPFRYCNTHNKPVIYLAHDHPYYEAVCAQLLVPEESEGFQGLQRRNLCTSLQLCSICRPYSTYCASSSQPVVRVTLGIKVKVKK